jgi:hypothetical protein
MVAVWDVRSDKPMKVFTAYRSRPPPGGMSRSGSRAMGDRQRWWVVVRGFIGLDYRAPVLQPRLAATTSVEWATIISCLIRFDKYI